MINKTSCPFSFTTTCRTSHNTSEGMLPAKVHFFTVIKKKTINKCDYYGSKIGCDMLVNCSGYLYSFNGTTHVDNKASHFVLGTKGWGVKYETHSLDLQYGLHHGIAPPRHPKADWSMRTQICRPEGGATCQSWSIGGGHAALFSHPEDLRSPANNTWCAPLPPSSDTHHGASRKDGPLGTGSRVFLPPWVSVAWGERHRTSGGQAELGPMMSSLNVFITYGEGHLGSPLMDVAILVLPKRGRPSCLYPYGGGHLGFALMVAVILVQSCFCVKCDLLRCRPTS